MSEDVVSSQFPELHKFVHDSFEFVNGFSRLNWKAIDAYIEAHLAENRAAAWNEASMAWTEELRIDLGGNYTLLTSGRFVLLSELETGVADRYVQFAEASAEKIKSILTEAAWATEFGMHVILLFSDDDDYYQYISYFYPAGSHPASSGVCLSRDYVHIAV